MKTILVIILILNGLINCYAKDLRYNAYQKRWEFADRKEVLMYNAYEKEWSYEYPNSTLLYNYLEQKWQYDKARCRNNNRK